MKQILLAVVVALFFVGCSKSQKEDVNEVVEDMTGITTVHQGQKALNMLDSISTADVNRANDDIMTGDEE